VDGWLARRTGTVTPIGRVLDPLADKLLVALALLAFVQLGIPGVEVWMVAAIVGREFLVTGLRSFAGRHGLPLPVSGLGKWKTTFQMSFVTAVLALMSLRAWMDPSPSFWKQPGDALRAPVKVAFLVTTLLTIASGLDYAWRARAAFGRARGRAA
jgi:CDP-diacylglycerol--glycerol-3-phosphate 3-phosphatidyltransferase